MPQAFHFLQGAALGLFGQVGFFDARAQFVDFLGPKVAFAQFGLDRPHLLAQIGLALAAIHFALHPRLDFVFQFQAGQCVLQGLQGFLQPRFGVGGAQKLEHLVVLR